jgi:hypothetical protein
MSLIENQLITALKKRFSITTEIIEDGDEVSLIVNSHLSGDIIFTQKTDLQPFIDIILKRIEDEKESK